MKCYVNFLIILNSHRDPLQLVYYTGQVLYRLNQGLQLVQSHPVFTKKKQNYVSAYNLTLCAKLKLGFYLT